MWKYFVFLGLNYIAYHLVYQPFFILSIWLPDPTSPRGNPQKPALCQI